MSKSNVIWTKHETNEKAICGMHRKYGLRSITDSWQDIYPILPDPKAAKDNLVRIVDESGEDYLYDESHFVFVDFPSSVGKKILALQNAT